MSAQTKKIHAGNVRANKKDTRGQRPRKQKRYTRGNVRANKKTKTARQRKQNSQIRFPGGLKRGESGLHCRKEGWAEGRAMENFSLNLDSVRREAAYFPPVSHIAYNRADFQMPVPLRRTSINFGIVLSTKTGRTGYRIGDQEYESEVPAFIFTCPGPEYCAVNPGPVEKFYFSYRPEHLKYFQEFTIRPECVLTPFRREFDLTGILQEIFHLSATVQHPGNSDRLDCCCIRLVQEMLLNLRDRKRRDPPYAAELYRIASYLDLHFTEHPDLEALVRSHGMSYRNFLRYWKQRFGIPPGLYLRRKQLDEACRLLEDTELKIYEIAIRSGFSDPYYFIRAFHKEKHQSPRSYRAAHRTKTSLFSDTCD